MVRQSTVTGQISGQVMRRNSCQRVGAVELGRLVELRRDVPQAGEEQQDREAVGPPDGDAAPPIGMNQAGRRQTCDRLADDRLDDVLRDAELQVEHPLPDQVDDRDRQDEGQEERGEDDALQPALEAAHHQRDGERDHRAGHDGQQHEVGVFQTAVLNSAVAEKPHVVVEADPGALADQRRVGEAEAPPSGWSDR